MLHAARCKYGTQKTRQKSPSGHHRTTLSGYIFATTSRIDNRKKMLNRNISRTCSYNMVNLGLLAPEICWRVWGTPATTSLNGGQQNFAGCLTSPGLVHYIYIFGSCCPITEFCHVQNSLCVLHVLCSPILAALLYGTQAVGSSQTLRHWAHGATYIRQGDHHVGHWPTF